MIDRALRLARQFHHLSLSDVAERLSVSKAYLSEIENGKKRPTLPILEAYAAICGIPLSSLILFSEGLEPGSKRAKVAKKALDMLEWATTASTVR